MTEDVLKPQIGRRVQLQRFGDHPGDRYQVRVIGYLPGQSLLVTNPVVDDKALFFREGQRFALRMLDGGNIWGFICHVRYAASKPYPHLHLSYPDEVECIAVRNAERIETKIPALAKKTSDPDQERYWHPVLVRDLSLSGARLESVDVLGTTDDDLELRFDVEVCGQVDSLNVTARIRNLSGLGTEEALEHLDRSYAGVEFQTTSRYQELLLHGYILEVGGGFA